jgi:hypothetical protein
MLDWLWDDLTESWKEKGDITMKDLLHMRAWEVQESPIDLGYRVVPEWGKLPEGWSLGPVSGVATDSKNRVYVFHRGSEAELLIRARDGDKWLDQTFIIHGERR